MPHEGVAAISVRGVNSRVPIKSKMGWGWFEWYGVRELPVARASEVFAIMWILIANALKPMLR